MTKLIQEHNLVGAWIAAMDHLRSSPRHEDFNLILDIDAPLALSPAELEVCQHVSQFLVGHNAQALHTVANTVFPADLYRRYGATGVFEHYPNRIYPRIRKCRGNQWGTYVQRMVRRTDSGGKVVIPLKNIIDRLKTEIAAGGNPKRARYELNLVDPFLDLSTSDPTLPGDERAMGGPCLSHLSFKLREGSRVALTAFYRSHYYTARALGNLIGLSYLLNFVATESGLQPGPLTCISSLGKIDSGENWRVGEVTTLISECKGLLTKAGVGVTACAA
jgi:hypothetical protein